MKKINLKIEKMIIHLYCNIKLPTTKIAKLTHVSPTTVSKALKRNGLKIRNISESKKGIKKGTKFPVKDIIKLYKSNKTSDEIAKKFKTTKRTILIILRNNNIQRRKAGWKKEYKHPLTNKIRKLYLGGASINLVKNQTGLSYSGINKILKKENLIRTEDKNKGMIGKHLSDNTKEKVRKTKNIRKENGLYDHIYLKKTGLTYSEFKKQLPDFKKYYERVRFFTNKEPIQQLKNFHKRGVVGIEGSYNLDHKFSIIEGFKQNILPSIIGNIHNLEMLPWEENMIKQGECSINLEDLMSLIYPNNVR